VHFELCKAHQQAPAGRGEVLTKSDAAFSVISAVRSPYSAHNIQSNKEKARRCKKFKRKRGLPCAVASGFIQNAEECSRCRECESYYVDSSAQRRTRSTIQPRHQEQKADKHAIPHNSRPLFRTTVVLQKLHGRIIF
jgi:hypothetical protein